MTNNKGCKVLIVPDVKMVGRSGQGVSEVTETYNRLLLRKSVHNLFHRGKMRQQTLHETTEGELWLNLKEQELVMIYNIPPNHEFSSKSHFFQTNKVSQASY